MVNRFAREVRSQRSTAPDGHVPRFGRSRGRHRRDWQLSAPIDAASYRGWVRASSEIEPRNGLRGSMYVTAGEHGRCIVGESDSTGVRRGADGSEFVDAIGGTRSRRPRRLWNQPATTRRTTAPAAPRFASGAQFPFPEVAVRGRGCLRFFVGDKPDALIVDFFAGSGTTAHAVMRLNKQDGGRRRQSWSPTTRFRPTSRRRLREKGFARGPRVGGAGGSASTSRSRGSRRRSRADPDGEPIKGDYKFTDEFPMAEGFEENVEFFTMTYEAPLRGGAQPGVRGDRAVALAARPGRRAGGSTKSRRTATSRTPMASCSTLDQLAAVPRRLIAAADGVRDGLHRHRRRTGFPDGLRGACLTQVEPVRLYESYLTNFDDQHRAGVAAMSSRSRTTRTTPSATCCATSKTRGTTGTARSGPSRSR